MIYDVTNGSIRQMNLSIHVGINAAWRFEAADTIFLCGGQIQATTRNTWRIDLTSGNST
jgi:hypothetical protein